MDEQTKAKSEEFLLNTALELSNIKIRIKKLESEEEAKSDLLMLQMDALEIDPSVLVHVNLAYNEKNNGFKNDMIPLLKQKGLRDCIKVTESIENRVVNEQVDTGVLTEDEVKEYRKPNSRFFTLPRGM